MQKAVHLDGGMEIMTMLLNGEIMETRFAILKNRVVPISNVTLSRQLLTLQ